MTERIIHSEDQDHFFGLSRSFPKTESLSLYTTQYDKVTVIQFGEFGNELIYIPRGL